MQHFCTYFDINYIHRGLTLYRSLERHSSQFTLWILCFDDQTYNLLSLLNLSSAKLIKRKEFEAGDDKLVTAQSDRSLVEYYWTCTPSLPLFIFKQNQELDSICYVDADVFFFSDPSPIFNSLDQGSIFIIPHDHDENVYSAPYKSGLFNVGILVFRRDEIGLQCLNWWREQCIRWCLHENEDGKCGDQGYLNDWPERFQRVIISRHPGIHAGPWNISKYKLRSSSEDHFFINGNPLICFHFHALTMISYHIALAPEGHTFMNKCIRDHIYRPYMLAQQRSLRELQILDHHFSFKLDLSVMAFLLKRLLRGTWSSNVIKV